MGTHSSLRLFPPLCCTLLLLGVPSSGGENGSAPDSTGRSTRPAALPNVLLITLDQLAYDYLGATSGAGLQIQTPHLDALIADGVLFRKHYVDSEICHPSRSSVFTGKPPHCHGALDNGLELPDAEVTLAETFDAHGYATLGIGKIHTAEEGADQGFDVFLDASWHREFLEERGWNSSNSVQWLNEDYKIGWDALPNEIRGPRMTTEFVREFVRQVRRTPWFVYMSYSPPHPPWAPSPDAWTGVVAGDVEPTIPDPGVWSAKPVFQQARFQQLKMGALDLSTATLQQMAYVAMIEDMDAEIGQVLDELDALGVRQNTVIVFTADHGDMAGQLGVFDKLFGPYESVAHVPLVVAFSASLPAGTVVDEFSQGMDIAPTLYELVGVDPPAGMVGTSLVDLALGGPPVHDAVFCAYEPDPSSWMVSDGTHVLIQHPTDQDELYDLSIDPEQATSVFDDPAYDAVRLDLEARLAAWRQNGCD